MLSGVSKTALLTLRARVDEHRRADGVLVDPLGERWWREVSWPQELDAWYAAGAQQSLALRAADIDAIVGRYAEVTGPLTLVELGAGLSTRQSRLEHLPITAWYDVDLPPVIALRKAWGASGVQLASSVLDLDWMDRVEGRAVLFIAEGLLYYLPRPAVDALLLALGRRFPGAALLMDVIGAQDAVKLRAHTANLGTPIAWSYAGDFAEVLPAFGLDELPGFDPDRLMLEMFERFWSRLDPLTRGLTYWVLSQPGARAARSGMVLGRLGAR
jgi:O-methyltransferase involved in polyketide biosynthesis